MSEILSLRVGDYLLGIEFYTADAAEAAKKAWSKFLTPADRSDICLRLRPNKFKPDLTGWEKVFESGNIWSMYRLADQYAIQRGSAFDPQVEDMLLVICKDFRDGEFFSSNHNRTDPFVVVDHFWLQIVFVNFLACNQGVLLHAAAVDDGGTGRLFAGNSGAGKSTMANFWQSSGKGEVLCDDRVIVRKHEGRFWIYGTPWFGTAGIAVPAGAPLEQIFILKQSTRDQANPLHHREAATRLLTRSFPAFWSPEGMKFTMDFLSELCQEIPCFELEFLQHKEVIDYVQCLTLK